MFSLRHISIANKMTLLACVSAGAALLLACLGFATYGVHTLRRSKLARLQDRATVLAFYAAPVVTVGDSRAGERVLESLASDPTIELAHIINRDNQLVASFGQEADSSQQADPETASVWELIDLGYVDVVQPIEVAGQEIGRVFLRANTTDLEAELQSFAHIAAYVLAAAMLLGVLLSSRIQRAISRPILLLTDVAYRITTENDYSIRVNDRAGAELATLQTAFNRMLDQVQRSEHELQQAHDKLEERVEARTRELSEEISRRKAIQVDLERAKDAAEAASRAKSEFLANMSHELRTPLNGIVGFTDLLLQDAGQWVQDEQRDYLERIQRSSSHLLELISDILDLSKIEAGRMDVEKIECSPHRVISEVTSMLSVRAQEKGLSLTYQWSAPMPATAQTDPSRLRQLLVNLVTNAIKFTETGTIRVTAGMDAQGAQPQLRIDVQDSGIGIPPEHQSGIFDPFTQADTSVTRKFGGTGLGLAICRKITTALGGDLSLRSQVGQGSTFSATIDPGPLDTVRMLSDDDFDLDDEEDFTKERLCVELPPIRVLVVDDGDTNRKLIELLLRRAGAQPDTAENGKQACEMAADGAYELILMDMQMPVMDGYTATEKLRARGIESPIIALTAHAMKGDDEKCLAAGCTGYLTKPVDGDHLLAVVAEAVGGNVVRRKPLPPTSESPPQDQSRIVSTLPTDDAEFLEIVEEFVERLAEKLELMSSALQEEDGRALADLAHWLKGAGGTAGFDAFTDPARLLEQAAREGSFSGAREQVRQLRQIACRLLVQPSQSHATSG